VIHFELVTLDGVKFTSDVFEVQLPTTEGVIGIFKNHAPLVSMAVPGVITIRHKENEPDDLQELIATNGGVIEILDDHVRLLVDEADLAEEINEKEIQDAHAKALELRAEAKDQVSLDHAQSLVERTAVRLKVAELRKGRRRTPKTHL
jgi:F-type H+-transporting ATPase subunit epsilon